MVDSETVELKNCYFYLLYKRKGDETTQIPIDMNDAQHRSYDSETDTITVSFEPDSYFTNKSGSVDIQVFACQSTQDFSTEDVNIENVAAWTTFNTQITVAKSQLQDSQTIISEDLFTKEIDVLASFMDKTEEFSSDAEEFASDAEEFAKGQRSDGLTVPHASTGAHDNAKDYKDLAKDWASKIGGAVESGEYSAKYYAVVSDTRSQESEAYALGTKGGTPVPAFADKNSKDWATKTGSTVDGTNYSSKQYALYSKDYADIVSAHATAIDAIGDDLTNIDAVATDILDDDSAIDTVATNIADVTAVAGNETNIITVAGKATEITTVAGIASNVTTVAGISSDVTAVAGIASDVSAVEDIKTDVSAVASIDSDVSAVATIASDVSAVADIDDDVTTVATNVSDVSAVADDITNVNAVADDLTNIDAVAGDLTNIDNAEANALKAEGWAVGTQNGTPVTSDSPYYENNAKYYGSAIPNIQSQIVNLNAEVDNIEALIGEEAEVTNTDPSSGTLLAQSRLIHHANLLPNGSLGRLGARSVAFNQLCPKFTATSTTIGEVTFVVDSDGVVTATWSSTTTADRTYALWGSTDSWGASIAGGHYVLAGYKPSGTSTEIRYAFYDSNGTSLLDSGITDGSTSKIFQMPSGNPATKLYYALRIVNGTPAGTAKFYPQFHDLTTMNLASLTASEFRALFPASYYPYTLGTMYDLNPSGFRIRGINLWDEESKTGYYDTANGEFVVYAGVWKGNTNPIKVEPSTSYYVFTDSTTTASMGNVLFYDFDGNYLSYVATPANGSFTTPANCAFVNFYANVDYFDDHLQFCYDSLPSSVKTVYHPSEASTILTPQISDGHYVNDTVYDYVENVVEDGVIKGKKHTKVGSYTFADTDAWNDASPLFYLTIGVVNANKDAMLGKAYTQVTSYADVLATDKSFYIGGTDNDTIFVHDSAFTSASVCANDMAGSILYYALPTETVTDCEPLRSFPISDYSTVEPITPQTDLANRIDVPFSVKTKSANTLIQQIRTNTANIATNTAQISNHESRIENLEQKAGDYSTVQYRGTNSVPSGKAKNALVESIVGKSRAWNQMAINGNFADVSTWQTNNCSYAVSGNVATVTTTDSVCAVLQDFNVISGHVYFCSFSCKASNSTMQLRLSNSYGGDDVMASKNTNWQTLQSIWTCNTTVSGSMPRVYANDMTGGDTFQVKEFILRDLTPIFGAGNEPSTVAECVQKCPDILKYDAYGYSLVDTTVEGVKSKSANVVDADDLLGSSSMTKSGDVYSCSDAYALYSYTYDNRIFKDFKPNTQYTLSWKVTCGNVVDVGWVFKYTDGTTSGRVANSSSTSEAYVSATSASGKTVDFIYSDYGSGQTFSFRELMVNEGTTALPYSPYGTLDTLSLPSPVTLRSAGSVAEEYYPETGERTEPIGSVDFYDLVWTKSGNDYKATLPILTKHISDTTAVANMVCSKYLVTSQMYFEISNMRMAYFSTDSSESVSKIIVYDTAGYADGDAFRQANNGTILYFELATPNAPTQLTPVIDNFIPTEGGGTINTIQTQTPVIDNCLDAGYLAL